MGKRKKTHKPKPFESTMEAWDTSANIYFSMLNSAAFKGLSKSAKVLYLYCKAQYYGEKQKPIPKTVTLTDDQRQRCFTMSVSQWQAYELYNDNGVAIKRDFDELIAAGFIDVIENGRQTRTKSIYMFSYRWQKK